MNTIKPKANSITLKLVQLESQNYTPTVDVLQNGYLLAHILLS